MIKEVLDGASDLTLKNLGAVIARLDALQGQLSDHQPNWRQDFFDAWFSMEQVYSFALASSQERLTEKQEATTQEALSALRRLIDHRLP